MVKIKGMEGTRTKRQMGPMHSSTSNKFTTLHKRPRRSNRPIKAKVAKGARLLAEAAAATEAKKAVYTAELAERRRLLTKLLARHKAAGNVDRAAETQNLLDNLGM